MALRRRRLALLLSLPLSICVLGGYFLLQGKPAEAPAPASQPQFASDMPLPLPAANIDSPDSLTVVVNKQRPLPDGFAPSDLRGELRLEAAEASDRLLAAAGRAGVPMRLISGYRSQSLQAAVYNSYVQKDGMAAADTYSARPRYSEHQTGLAADYGNGVCDLEACFGDTAAGKWLAANAHTFGFILRYPADKTAVTGYTFEPWHLRYVGIEAAGQIVAAGKTMEEFYGLPPAPAY